MSWDDECLPGDMSYDYIFGGNQSGMFPDRDGFIVSDKKLYHVTYSHSDGDSWNIYIQDEWDVKSKKDGVIKVLNPDGTVETFRISHDKRWKRRNNIGEPVVLKEV